MAHKTHLKIHVFEIVPMSKDGYLHWSPKLRAKIGKIVYKWQFYNPAVPVEELSSKKAIGRWASENLYSGRFQLRGYSHGKTRTHVKLVSLCNIILRLDDDGKYMARVIHAKHARLTRYFFWSEGKR